MKQWVIVTILTHHMEMDNSNRIPNEFKMGLGETGSIDVTRCTANDGSRVFILVYSLLCASLPLSLSLSLSLSCLSISFFPLSYFLSFYTLLVNFLYEHDCIIIQIAISLLSRPSLSMFRPHSKVYHTYWQVFLYSFNIMLEWKKCTIRNAIRKLSVGTFGFKFARRHSGLLRVASF